MNVTDTLYLDTSALIAVYRQERFSVEVQALVSSVSTPLFLTQLSLVEFSSALARLVRMGDMDDVRALHTEELFAEHLREGYFQVEPITESVFTQARAWISARETALRTLDALHLASAAHLHARLVTADRLLGQAANRFGIASTVLGTLPQ